jgi:hypothetical protein
MKNCLNCKKEIDIVGDFCSTKCNDDWQANNQKCIRCGKTINLLEDEFKIENNKTQDPQMVCLECHNDGNAGKIEEKNTDKNDDPPPPQMVM